MYTHTKTRTCTQKHICTQTITHTYTQIYTYTHIFILIHTFIQTHTHCAPNKGQILMHFLKFRMNNSWQFELIYTKVDNRITRSAVRYLKQIIYYDLFIPSISNLDTSGVTGKGVCRSDGVEPYSPQKRWRRRPVEEEPVVDNDSMSLSRWASLSLTWIMRDRLEEVTYLFFFSWRNTFLAPWSGHRTENHHLLRGWCNRRLFQLFFWTKAPSPEELHLCHHPTLQPHPLKFPELNWRRYHQRRWQLQFPLRWVNM